MWDSPEEIEAHYQNDQEFQKLLDEDSGMNVMQFHHAIVVGNTMDDWTNYIMSISKTLLQNQTNFDTIKEEFENIAPMLDMIQDEFHIRNGFM